MPCAFRSQAMNKRPICPTAGAEPQVLASPVANRGPNRSCDPIKDSIVCPRAVERCCDQNECCALFPSDCRNPYWPRFAHPRWLCCRDLYSGV
jgi:hypothetical protein